MKSFLIAAAAALCLTAGAAQATTRTVGVADTNNCVPYACGVTNGFEVTQQIYAASAFSGPMEIGSISFFRDLAATFNTGTMDTQTISLAFYTTSKAVNTTQNGGPDGTNMASNLGTLLSDFGTFTISGQIPSVLTFTGNAFTYNPAAGNLILQITSLSGSVLWDGAAFQADSRGTVTRRVTPGRFGNGPIALVTQFSSPTAVPEPATWALLIGGFGAAGVALRRRRAVAA